MPSATEIDDLCFTPAVELAARIRSRKLSPVELADAFLDRIARVNPRLNAYVTPLPDAARARAKQAEAAAMRGDFWGPLHGVPISIKDLAWTKGVRTTCGSRVYADRVPDEDSPAVARLLAAGGINLGKTNTPEFGWLATTDNEVFGKTNNPWNVAYTPSGSSGGAGAACAAGVSPIALGSDGGGSIRHPASFCGVVGHKPTFGLVPRHPAVDGWPSLSHQGPLARTVADCALAMDVLSGFEPRDMHSAKLPPQEFLKSLDRDFKGVRLAWSADLGFAEVDPAVRAGFKKALGAFAGIAGELREASPDLRDTRDIFKGVMFSEAVAAELRYIDADGSSLMNPDLAKFIAKRADIPARDYLAAMEARDRLAVRVADFFRDFDLLLTPTMAIPPFKHPMTAADYPHTVNGVEVSATGWHPFTFPFNLTHQPAISVPCGFTDDGLPLGLQIVGRRFEDLLVLQAAHAFERERPWAGRRPAP